MATRNPTTTQIAAGLKAARAAGRTGGLPALERLVADVLPTDPAMERAAEALGQREALVAVVKAVAGGEGFPRLDGVLAAATAGRRRAPVRDLLAAFRADCRDLFRRCGIDGAAGTIAATRLVKGFGPHADHLAAVTFGRDDVRTRHVAARLDAIAALEAEHPALGRHLPARAAS